MKSFKYKEIKQAAQLPKDAKGVNEYALNNGKTNQWVYITYDRVHNEGKAWPKEITPFEIVNFFGKNFVTEKIN